MEDKVAEMFTTISEKLGEIKAQGVLTLEQLKLTNGQVQLTNTRLGVLEDRVDCLEATRDKLRGAKWIIGGAWAVTLAIIGALRIWKQ